MLMFEKFLISQLELELEAIIYKKKSIVWYFLIPTSPQLFHFLNRSVRI